MNHLHRELAPIDDEAWSQVDEDARTRLVAYLGGRRVVDFTGPLGWKHSSVTAGRVEAVADRPAPGVEAGLRSVLAMAEICVPFSLKRSALDDASRGNPSIDLDGLDEAAKTIATTENVAIFHGWAGGGIAGMSTVSSHEPLVADPADREGYARSVAMAVESLALAGIGGPYALVLGNETWVSVVGGSERGTTLSKHLAKILDGGPLLWAPGVDGAIVLSQRGGDFEFVSGQDLSIGFRSADLESVTLYLEETFTFRVIEPDAAIAVRSVDGS